MGASYKSTRPQLTVEITGGRNLGRCYNLTQFRVTSLVKLKTERIKGLRTAGFLGYGQEFTIVSKCDGSEEPVGFDTVPCLEDDGKPAINDLNGKPYPDSQQPYYVYDCEDRCDSGD